MAIVENKVDKARKFGFTGFLFLLAAGTSLADAIQNHHFGAGRIAFIVIFAFLGCFFLYTWWNVRRGSL